MKRVAILSPHVVAADAVSNDVQGMAEALMQCGCAVRLFAQQRTGPKVADAEEVAAFVRPRGSLLIYHHSVGWERGVDLVCNARCRRVVKYHNVTPPHFFEGISSEIAAACTAGRDQLLALAAAGCERYLADSEFNQSELLAAGVSADRCAVVPPFHQAERLEQIEPNAATLAARPADGRRFLTVGRVVPNKGHAAMLDAFAAYHHDYDPDSQLVIVGKEDDRLGVYSTAVRARIRQWGLDGAVTLAGEVSEAVLKAHYLAADVFLLTSAHEGFCVPLVEAMALRRPVVAVGATAVPGTLGDAGLMWENPNPELLAAAARAVVRDQALTARLGTCGRQRYEQHFTTSRIQERLLDALR